MTDLIQRLHHHANGDCDMTPVGSDLLEAATRIKELLELLTTASSDAAEADARARVLEDKLGSALEMLRSFVDQAQHARFVLRELENEE